MDAFQHVVYCGSVAVGGAWLQNNGGIPIVSSLVKQYAGSVLGNFTDVVIGAGTTFVGMKLDNEVLGDGVMGAGVGFTVSAVFNMFGL